MATYTVFNAEIKVFKEYIDSDNFDLEFFLEHNLEVGDVFVSGGTAYRIIDEFGDGDFFASEIDTYGLDEWVLSGNTHPKVKWHGTYATYDGEVNVSLFSHNGGTYFYIPYAGKIVGYLAAQTRCEYTNDKGDY